MKLLLKRACHGTEVFKMSNLCSSEPRVFVALLVAPLGNSAVSMRMRAGVRITLADCLEEIDTTGSSWGCVYEFGDKSAKAGISNADQCFFMRAPTYFASALFDPGVKLFSHSHRKYIDLARDDFA
jgi:hypothetical protein